MVKSALRVVLVTGASGAGRVTSIQALEDLGYESINNIPLSLIPRLLERPLERPLALGIDPRTREFSTEGFFAAFDALAALSPVQPEILFLECRPDVLLRRFSETRRRHPLAPKESPMIGIEREIELLKSIRDRADFLFDSSETSPHELRAEVSEWFAVDTEASLAVTVHSFSYKKGLPRGLDMILDCRFLNNPHWDIKLRPMTGRDAAVVRFIEQDERYAPFISKITDLTEFLLPAYVNEGKAHFSIGFGCTGGQHRSVATAERIARALAHSGWQVSIRHRELDGAFASVQKPTVEPINKFGA